MGAGSDEGRRFDDPICPTGVFRQATELKLGAGRAWLLEDELDPMLRKRALQWLLQCFQDALAFCVWQLPLKHLEPIRIPNPR
jgi:hypothetical protein